MENIFQRLGEIWQYNLEEGLWSTTTTSEPERLHASKSKLLFLLFFLRHFLPVFSHSYFVAMSDVLKKITKSRSVSCIVLLKRATFLNSDTSLPKTATNILSFEHLW